MKKMCNEGNQIHNLISSSGSGTVINYGSGSGSDFLTSYGSGYGSGSTSQKVTVPTVPVPVPVPVPQHCKSGSCSFRHGFKDDIKNISFFLVFLLIIYRTVTVRTFTSVFKVQQVFKKLQGS
jgi:hypothetical protein